jgi:hypothetical protein
LPVTKSFHVKSRALCRVAVLDTYGARPSRSAAMAHTGILVGLIEKAKATRRIIEIKFEGLHWTSL